MKSSAKPNPPKTNPKPARKKAAPKTELYTVLVFEPGAKPRTVEISEDTFFDGLVGDKAHCVPFKAKYQAYFADGSFNMWNPSHTFWPFNRMVVITRVGDPIEGLTEDDVESLLEFDIVMNFGTASLQLTFLPY